MSIARWFLVLAAASGGLTVMAGAFGAHALRTRFDDYAMGVFQTAASYQMYHSLALLGVGLWCLLGGTTPWLKASGGLFVTGIVLFSGSLYLLSFTGVRILGAVTPLGGLAFIAGWVCLAVAALKLP